MGIERWGSNDVSRKIGVDGWESKDDTISHKSGTHVLEDGVDTPTDPITTPHHNDVTLGSESLPNKHTTTIMRFPWKLALRIGLFESS